jgi:hypothetical protein
MVTDHPSPGSRLRREQRLGKGGDVLKWTHSANDRLTQGHQAALSFAPGLRTGKAQSGD